MERVYQVAEIARRNNVERWKVMAAKSLGRNVNARVGRAGMNRRSVELRLISEAGIVS